VEKCGGVQNAIDDKIVLHRKEAVGIPIGLPRQQWLCEHALVLCCTLVACLI
jgi:hypothetical protein